MSEVSIQFQGFHPTEFTRALVDSKLHELQEAAPDGAVVHAVFKRQNRILVASVRILSTAGDLFATARGTHLREVSRRLTERTRRQLRRIKAMRSRRFLARTFETPA